MLTPKQEKYVQNLIAGMSQRKAYRDAYPTAEDWTDEAVDAKASEMLSGRDPYVKVLVRYQELQDKAASEACLTREMKRKKLRELAESEHPSVVLKAIDLDNKMEGEYTQHVDLAGDLDLRVAIDYGDEDED